MFGNWAIGRVTITTVPTITVRIEMTIATIGRFMKNLDTLLTPSDFGVLSERLGVHMHTGANLLDAHGDYALAWFQALVNHPHRADSVAYLDRRNAYRILA